MGWVGSILGFNRSVMAAVFMCMGMVEVALISVVTLLNSGDKISQKCL